jgi:hypothetical protein
LAVRVSKCRLEGQRYKIAKADSSPADEDGRPETGGRRQARNDKEELKMPGLKAGWYKSIKADSLLRSE